jgi:hypothetical protein
MGARKQVDTSGKSRAFFHHPEILYAPVAPAHSCFDAFCLREPASTSLENALAGASVAIAAEKSSPTIEIAPDRRGPSDRLRVAEPRALVLRLTRFLTRTGVHFARKRYGDLNMNTAPDPTISTAIAATDPTKAAAAPRIKLQSHVSRSTIPIPISANG